MKNRAIMILGLSLMLGACSDPQYPLNRLEGKWYCKTPDGNWVSESWEKHSDDLMKGVGKEIKGEEESVTEYLELKRMGDGLIYSATVPTQNEGDPVEFICDSSSMDFLRFSNPGHDFPKFIEYQITDDTHMVVTVGNNAQEQFVLNFSKEKN